MRVECHLIRTLHDALPICRRVAAVLGMRRSDITFTAGGTEAANLAIKGLALAEPRGRHLVTSPIEHEAVLASIEHLRSEENTSELQTRGQLVCRILLDTEI